MVNLLFAILNFRTHIDLLIRSEANDPELVEGPYCLMSWYVYICVSKAGYYYVGISSKPTERLKMHNAGLGAKMAKDQGEFHLEYVSNPFSRQIIRAQT